MVQMWQGSPVPVQMWEGASPVPVQMWRQGDAPSRGADVGTAGPSHRPEAAGPRPVRVQMWAGASPVPQRCVHVSRPVPSSFAQKLGAFVAEIALSAL